MTKILKDKGISASTKVMLVRALIFPILKYGCESWTVKKKHREMLVLRIMVLETVTKDFLDGEKDQSINFR